MEDVGLLNMIIKQTLYSIHKFDHQWFHTPIAASFSLQIILSSSVARLQILKKIPYQSKRTLSRDSSRKNYFLFIQLGSKVLGLSVVQIKSEIKRHYLL